MVGVQGGERPPQSVALPGQVARFVRGRRIDPQQMDGARKAAPGQIPTATHDDAVEPGVERGMIAQIVPTLPRPNGRVMNRVLGLRLVSKQDGSEAIGSLKSSLRQPLEGSLALGFRLRRRPRSHSSNFTRLSDHATRCAQVAQSFNPGSAAADHRE